MKKYKVIIQVVPSVTTVGEIISEIVFSCEGLADRNFDIYAFAEQIFSFWGKSTIMGEAKEEWSYEYHVELP